MRLLRPKDEQPLHVDEEEASPIASKTSDPSDKHLIMRQTSVLRVVAEFIDQRSLAASLNALTGELHNRFPCDRVVVALMHKGQPRVASISQQATIDPKSAEVKQLVNAIREACEQDAQIQFPTTRRTLHIAEAHRMLAAGRENAEILTTPLCHQGELIGGILIERTSKQPWATLTIELIRQISDVLAPMIELRQASERGLLETLSDKLRNLLPSLVKPRHVLRKLTIMLIVGTLVGAYFLPTTHRVTAQAELAATERRIITAPMAGYIEGVSVQAGDRVQQGQLLLTLDTRDLELERAKAQNELNSVEAEFRSAMASHDRNKMAVIQAKSMQAQAQLELVQAQLDRGRIMSPTNGMVVKGDLNQSLGAPVERGEALFEITPTHGHEVHLFVDEVDIPYIKIGQSGALSLKSNPNQAIEFNVRSIHPIAQPEDGANHFRVEATLDETLDETPRDIRPGQTGIGKLDVGQARLLWVWSHRFVEWCEQKIWEWSG